MLDYITKLIEPYITYSNILLFISIVLPILVLGVFWKSAARTRVIQVFSDLNRRYKS